MPEQPSPDAMATRRIAKQLFDVWAEEHGKAPRREDPPLVKWVVGAIAALGLAAMIGGGTWLVSTVASVQQTVIRMDERLANGAVKDARFEDLERRVTKLEGYHNNGGAQ